MTSKVFCIGMFKTGTTSIGKAFGKLGFETLNGPWWPEGVMLQDPWFEKPEEWERYYPTIKAEAEKFEAFQDYPWMFCYQQCDRWFPSSKFILTVRDPGAVADSDINMYQRNGVAESEIPLRERLVDRYVNHYDGVMRYFEGRDDLLVMNIVEGDGWDKLCEFLEKPVPGVPFPHKNRASPKKQWYQFWK